jgi:hypothetical protein
VEPDLRTGYFELVMDCRVARASRHDSGARIKKAASWTMRRESFEGVAVLA